MKLLNTLSRSALISVFTAFCAGAMLPVASAAATAPLPPVIQSGFALLVKSGGAVGVALDEWKKGGLIEDAKKAEILAGYFKRLDAAVGTYKSYELVESKQIGQSTELFYLAMNFERGAVYGRFLMYQTAKGWVVQDMDFTTKPEMIMPWLAFIGVNYSE
jgi:hypothetical protein